VEDQLEVGISQGSWGTVNRPCSLKQSRIMWLSANKGSLGTANKPYLQKKKLHCAKGLGVTHCLQYCRGLRSVPGVLWSTGVNALTWGLHLRNGLIVHTHATHMTEPLLSTHTRPQPVS
jgi:hypothetical protein